MYLFPQLCIVVCIFPNSEKFRQLKVKNKIIKYPLSTYGQMNARVTLKNTLPQSLNVQ